MPNSEADDAFFDRADAHIALANNQINEQASEGEVSASFLFSASRFNAWVNAMSFENADEMKQAKDESIEFFVNEYRMMLEDNLSDYIENYDEYLQSDE
ncbi:MAG TPA: DUF3144 domain-containing protein [Thiotrichaceae bacterium]|nr:DUF3144 domain-containing protein [Thiotrichaceae bacterium]